MVFVPLSLKRIMFTKVLNRIDRQLNGFDYTKTKEMVRLEKKQKQDALLKNIELILFPKWYPKSKTGLTQEQLYNAWNELLDNLYHCEALKKSRLYSQIDYVAKRNEEGVKNEVYM